MTNLSIEDERQINNTNEYLRTALGLRRWVIHDTTPGPASGVSVVPCSTGRIPYTPIPPVTDSRWDIWTVGNLDEVKRGLTAALLREVLGRADAVLHQPRKSRSKVPRAALIDEVLNTRRSFADMGLRPAVWVESSKWWCWVWKEGGGLCFGAATVPDQPAPEVLGEPGLAARQDMGENTVVRQDGTWFRSSDDANALLPEQRHRTMKKPGLAARLDAVKNTVVRQDGTWFRSSDVANALLPEQRHRTMKPGLAARQDAAECTVVRKGMKRSRGSDAADILLPRPRRRNMGEPGLAARQDAEQEKLGKPDTSALE